MAEFDAALAAALDEALAAELVTVISKAGITAVFVPFDALICTPTLTPTSELAGVPDRVPVLVSKDAHAGLPLIWKVMVAAFAADTIGRNV
jgi:hypothetical protein